MEAKLSVGGSLMHSDRKPDFSGWATKVGIKCSDGRTISANAFAHQDQTTVPLVWQHNHGDPGNVLGHVLLHNRGDEGVYAHGFFNETQQAKNAKQLVEHGDIKALSIFANQLQEKASAVMHGIIREVSLVLAGANPGALIDNLVLKHGDDLVTIDDEAIVYTGLEISHGDKTADTDGDGDKSGDTDGDGDTVQSVYDSMNDQQKNVVHYMVGAAMESASSSAEHSATAADASSTQNKKDGTHMSRNVFEQNAGTQTAPAAGDPKYALSHDAVKGIVADAQKNGSLKEAVERYALAHGINDIQLLFPEFRALQSTPQFQTRRIEWVAGVLGAVSHTPFSRIKQLVADLTQEQARAKGYIKGNLKKEEWFSVTRRTTTPTTIYKKQKLDRDDIIDITDFDVVAWLQVEMRMMLDEEIARAILIGDGRDVDDEDKIKDPAAVTDGAGIRSIMNEHELYAAEVFVNIDDASSSMNEVTDEIVSAMRFYRGSGNPTFYTTLPVLTKLLLTRDTLGRRLYRTAADVAAEIGCDGIVACEALESEPNLLGIIVNLRDYNIGADKGGEINMFDFFDIDYNQQKYLIETRVSGALTKIRSAIVVKKTAGANVLVTPVAPTQADNTISGINQAHVTYTVTDSTGTPVTVTGGAATIASADVSPVTVRATPASGYYFESDVEDFWAYEYQA
jgi:hypothetical protein